MHTEKVCFRILILTAIALLALVAGAPRPAAANAVPPPNDDFVDATVIDPLPEFPEWYSDEVDTSGATLEAEEPAPCGDIGATVWYKYTAASSGWLAAETQGHWMSGMASDFDTVLAVYTGASLDELTVVGCNDDRAERETSVVEFEAIVATTYYFQVGGFSAATGTLRFHLSDSCVPVPYVTYSGDVVINSRPAPDGTSIAAVIDGTEWGRTSTSSGEYVVEVPLGPLGRPPCFWGGRIEFYADGLLCFPTVVWGSGGPQQEVDLVCNAGDSDGDGFTDPVETHVGTDLQDACPDVTGSPGLCPGKDCNGDDCWPPDVNVDRVVDITDAGTFLNAFPSADGTPNYSQRLDFAYSDGLIDIFDAVAFLAFFPSACTNP